MDTTITRVETFLVAPRWLFGRVETQGGVVGWGEATCEGRSETVRTAVDQLAELLVGRDALRIEDHWQVLTKGSFYRGGPILASAVSGLDQALWDIEDDIRDKEAGQEFDDRFIALARSVYRKNDERAAIKRRINDLLGSEIVEEKSYRAY